VFLLQHLLVTLGGKLRNHAQEGGGNNDPACAAPVVPRAGHAGLDATEFRSKRVDIFRVVQTCLIDDDKIEGIQLPLVLLDEEFSIIGDIVSATVLGLRAGLAKERHLVTLAYFALLVTGEPE